MALLKDTVILGDARITDTLYANIITNTVSNITTANITKIIPASATYSTTITAGINYYNSDTLIGHIGASTGGSATGSLSLCAANMIVLRTGAIINDSNSTFDSNTGINFDTSSFSPKTTNTLALGTSSLKWSNIYSLAANIDTFNSTNIISGSTNSAGNIEYGINWYDSNNVPNCNGHIGSNSDPSSNALGLYAKGSIILRPGATVSNNAFDGTTGVSISTTAITPAAASTIALGSATYPFTTLYAGTISSPNTNSLKTLKLTANSTLYISSGSSASIIFCRGGADTTYEIFRLNASNVLLPSVTDTYDIGSSTVTWKNIYATTFTGALSGNATTATNLAGTATAGYVYAGPANGSAAAPSFRALTADDIPTLGYLPLNGGGTVTGNVNATSFTVDSAVTLSYNSTDLSLNFNFS